MNIHDNHEKKETDRLIQCRVIAKLICTKSLNFVLAKSSTYKIINGELYQVASRIKHFVIKIKSWRPLTGNHYQFLQRVIS